MARAMRKYLRGISAIKEVKTDIPKLFMPYYFIAGYIYIFNSAIYYIAPISRPKTGV